MVQLQECPHLLTPHNLNERKNIEKEYGKNSPFVRSMVYGEFMDSESGNQIFSTEDIERLMQAMLDDSTVKPVGGDIRASGDVSGGGDGQILMVREGSDVVYIDDHSETNEIFMAEYWVDELRTLGIEPWQFWIDGGGIGATVATYMELRLGYSGINRFFANKGAHDSDTQFANRYTELHWWMKELLAYGVLKLPYNKNLLDQCRRRQYVLMDGEKVKSRDKKLYRKENKNTSPDELDSLLYLLADFPIDALRRGRTRKKKATDTKKINTWEDQASKVSGSSEAFSILHKVKNIDLLRKSRNFTC